MSKFCTSCGNEIPEGMRFCGNCGTPVAQMTTPQEASLQEQRSPTQQDAPPQAPPIRQESTTPSRAEEPSPDPSAPRTSMNGTAERRQAQPEQDGSPFYEADRRYAELRRRHDAGEIDDGQFGAEVQQLAVQDGEGRWWSKHRDTGAWHHHDGSDWVPGTPPGYQPPEPEKAAPRRFPRRAVVLLCGVLALVVTGLAGYYSYYLLTTAPVPDLEGAPVGEAAQTAADAGLGFKVVANFYGEEYPKGIITSHSPGPSDRQELGDNVLVFISGGPEGRSIKVPDVSGLAPARAVETLLDAGLEPGELEVDGKEVGADLVYDQSGSPIGIEAILNDRVPDKPISETDPTAGSEVVADNSGDRVRLIAR